MCSKYFSHYCPYIEDEKEILVFYKELQTIGSASPSYKLSNVVCDLRNECPVNPCPVAEMASKINP